MKIESIEHLTKLMNEKPKIGRPKGSFSVQPADKICIDLNFGVTEKMYYKIRDFAKSKKKPFAKLVRAEINISYD
jgi:hypothetical protein